MAQLFELKTDDLTISKGLFRLVAFWFLAVLTTLYVSDALAITGNRTPCSISSEQRKVRLKHAHELLGRYYQKSSASNGESIAKINSAIYRWTKDHLPAKYKDQSGKIAQAIIDTSLKEKFDPVFLMSVIEGESSWRPEKIGGVGEIGLMQLRPATGKWMATRAGVKWKGDKTLLDPVLNVKIGATYLSYLRERFDDHARLYLAAYNMGQSNVDSALDKKIWPKDYPIHVMKRYVAFYESLNAQKAKVSDQFTVVMKYTPSPKKKKKHAAEIPTKDDDTYFDVDNLVKSSDDVNDPKGKQSAESDADEIRPRSATVGTTAS